MTGYYQSHPTARLVHLFLFWGCEHDAFTYTEVQRSPGVRLQLPVYIYIYRTFRRAAPRRWKRASIGVARVL